MYQTYQQSLTLKFPPGAVDLSGEQQNHTNKHTGTHTRGYTILIWDAMLNSEMRTANNDTSCVEIKSAVRGLSKTATLKGSKVRWGTSISP